MSTREIFREKLRTEKDTEFLQALLLLASTWSQEWVVDDIKNEIEIRRQNVTTTVC